MHFQVTVYQRKLGQELEWTTLGFGALQRTANGRDPLKIQRKLVEELRKLAPELGAAQAESILAHRSLRLERLRLELTLRGPPKRRLTGIYPVVLEPRWTTEAHRILVGYHPFRQAEWFPVKETLPIEEQAATYFEMAWAELEDWELANLVTQQKDQLRTFGFAAELKSILDELPQRQKGVFDDLVINPQGEQDKKPPRGHQVLPKLGVNQTLRAIDGSLPAGVARQPQRDQLTKLLGRDEKRSALLIGPPGCGKTSIIQGFVRDLVDLDDYPSHHNLDRIHEVWTLSGKRIIAGMSMLGEWEKRVADIIADCARAKVILWIEDIHSFGRLGQSRGSDRALADLLRGPVARGEMTIIGECTPGQLQRLEDDAPSFAALFTRVMVHPTSLDETLRILLAEVQRLELEHPISFLPSALKSIFELGDALYPAAALPGKALGILRELAQSAVPLTAPAVQRARTEIGAAEVVRLLSKKTGLPQILLKSSEPLSADTVAASFQTEVAGQPEAVGAVVDLILRIRAGLSDPARPLGVYLFTGPTGTGKTELAACLASYLYSDPRRLIRLDMGELSGPDAAQRLIGDRFNPDGLLTRQILDQPFSVVLLDEIEKAHPSALNLLLQVFDEGRLTDAQGNTADFRQAVIIMTSNLGAQARSTIGFGEDTGAILHDVARAVRDFFPPELFNRVDRVVPFSPLVPAVARQIAEKELSRLVARRGLTERNIFVEFSGGIVDYVVERAFDKKLGARPVKRFVESTIGALLTDRIAASAGAALRNYVVFLSGSGIEVLEDVVREADPLDGDIGIEPYLELPAPDLTRALPGTLERLERHLGGDTFERISAEIQSLLGRPGSQSERVFELDLLRNRLWELRERLGVLIEALRPADDELIEAQRFSYERNEGAGRRVRRMDHRMMQPSLPPRAKEDMLSAIAEVDRLIRASTRMDAPSAHSVVLEILRVGKTAHPGRPQPARATPGAWFLSELVRAYATRGEIDKSAARTADGRIHAAQGVVEVGPRVEHVALRLSGLGIAQALNAEVGSHVGESLTRGTELISVRIHEGNKDPAQVLEAWQLKRAARDAAMALGASGLVAARAAHESLLPAVRRIKVEPTDSGAELVIGEDYLLAREHRELGSVPAVLERFWLLHDTLRVRPGGVRS
ncbi:MAG: AAA family ATPase [Myxococcota bacterium]